MTKMIRLRLEVPADDAVTTDAVQTALRRRLREIGQEAIGDAGLLEAPTVFWHAADVKRGPEERPNARGPRKAPAP